MSLRTRVLLLWVGFSALFLTACASSPGAGDAAHVFRDGIGARARGMGGAYVAWGGDASSLFWNPATLIQTPSLRLAGVHEIRYEGLVSVNSLAVSLSEERWGAGVIWCGSEMYSLYCVAGALRIGLVGVGFAAKTYSIGVSSQRARGVGFDVGVQIKVNLEGTSVAMGLVSRDLGWTRIVWQSVAGQAVDHAAWVTRVGGAVDSQGEGYSLAICADLELALRRPPLPGNGEYWRRALQLSAAVGIEFRTEWLALRTGFGWHELHTGNLAEIRISFGSGFNFRGVAIDLAVVPGELGPVYVFGAEFRFGSR